MKTDVAIFGAGGFGREIADTFAQSQNISDKYNLIGYFDDTLKKGEVVNGFEVLGSSDDILASSTPLAIVLALGSGKSRYQVFRRFEGKCVFPTIIHESAKISHYSKIGQGCVIQANCIVAANANIGNFVVMNANSGSGHDTNVGDFASIMSFCDVAGSSILEEYCFLGTGVKVIPNIRVAKNSILCAGSVVFREVKRPSKLMGNPAKIIEVIEDE